MPSEQKIILHIDDDDDIRTIAKMSLESIGGYNVISCNGYQQAIEKLEEQTPDFILVDVMMPDLDGPQTLNLLRQNYNMKGVPVAFMTAKIMDSEIQKLENLQINGVIKNPFEPIDLCNQIQEILNNI